MARNPHVIVSLSPSMKGICHIIRFFDNFLAGLDSIGVKKRDENPCPNKMLFIK